MPGRAVASTLTGVPPMSTHPTDQEQHMRSNVHVHPRTIAAVMAAACAALAFPAFASAETFCVDEHQGPCLLGGVQKTTIQAALSAAEGNAGADVVRIGAKDTPYDEGSLVYQSPEPVSIVGAGQDATVLTGNGVYPVLSLLSPSSQVSELGVQVPDAGIRTGLFTNARARSVAVSYTGPNDAARGVNGAGGAVFDHVRVSMSQGTGVYAKDLASAMTVVDGTVVAPRGVAINSSQGAVVKLSRDQVRSSLKGVLAYAADIDADNLVVTSTGAGTGVSSIAGSNVRLSHATIAGDNGPAGVAVSNGGTGTGALELENSVVSGYEHDLFRFAEPGASSDLTARYSSFAAAGDKLSSEGPGTLSIAGNGNLPDADPEFTAPDALVPIYVPHAESRLVDSADPADASTVDVGGDPRPVDGDGANGPRSDIGAYERAAIVPAPGAGEPAGGEPAGGEPAGRVHGGDAIAPVVSDMAVTRRFRLGTGAGTIRFRLSEPARVTLRFTRRLAGKRVKRARGAIKASAHDGLNRIRFKGRLSDEQRLRPGRWSVTLKATDAAGNRAEPQSRRFKLLRRRGA
jgi:hypothetical protein